VRFPSKISKEPPILHRNGHKPINPKVYPIYSINIASMNLNNQANDDSIPTRILTFPVMTIANHSPRIPEVKRKHTSY
jgi:hypothetical protein